MILLTIVSNLLGKSDFKKYVNVVMGMLLVLVAISPIIKLFSLDNMFDFSYEKSVFQLGTVEVAGQMKQAEEQQQEKIIESYKESIINQAEVMLEKYDLYLVQAEVEIMEDYDSSEFGQVQKLNVTASYSESKSIQSDPIEEITIDKIVIEDETQTKETQDTSGETGFATPLEIEVKNTFSDFYNISTDNINVTIQGGKHE